MHLAPDKRLTERMRRCRISLRVEGDHGKLGYADSDTVLGENDPAPPSPEEALRLQSERAKNPVVIPVFAEDGKTNIDSFTIGRGITSVEGKDE